MINRYKVNQQLRRDKKVIGYPFYLSSPKLGQFIPSIPRGKCLHVTASTNVGKSMFWRWYFLISPYLIYKMNPESNFKPKFIIFLLEETYEQLYDNLVSSFIFVKFGKVIAPAKLVGHAEDIISDAEMQYVEQVIPTVEDLLSHCKIVDNVYNPTGLFIQSRNELLNLGTRTYTPLKPSEKVITEEVYKKLPEETKKTYKFKKYTRNDENEYVFIITDNINLLEPEAYSREDRRMLSKHETLWRWSTEYAHKQLQKNYNAIVIDIIQQAADTEKQQYTFSGNNIIEKLKPSREGYANNKEVARNADIILGLFAPSFYGVSEYGKTDKFDGYNLNVMGDYFRTVIILKNRIGRGFKEIPLFFNGAVNYFTELSPELGNKEKQEIVNGTYRAGFKSIK